MKGSNTEAHNCLSASILVATDVTVRGLDIAKGPEVHANRTGRAIKCGCAAEQAASCESAALSAPDTTPPTSKLSIPFPDTDCHPTNRW
ncbi:hypothetical protein [Microbulbifer sp. ZKSA002]|uniref:hypothetical protein n=1 Tax=Microbulbifer sp. ZKSA002 TaxID=3243388 RepID=UPI004039738E